jgi:hypothetical protein
MPRFFALLVSLFLVFPAAAAIVAGPERPVTAPVLQPAAFDQRDARIATDGEAFLAVWQDLGEFRSDVHAARLTSEGRRIDDVPLVIAATTEFGEGRPDAAFGAGRYLVAWQAGISIRFRFVSPDGTMSEPVTLDEGENPRVAFNGSVFLLVYSQFLGVRAVVIDANGNVLHWIDTTDGTQIPPQVVAVNGAFHVVTALQTVAFRRIEEDGTMGPRQAIDLAPNLSRVAVSADRGDVLVAWQANGQIRVARGTQVVETFPEQSFVLDALIGDLVVYRDAHNLYVSAAGSDAVQAVPIPRPLYVSGGVSNDAGRTVLAIHAWDTVAADDDVFAHVLGTNAFEPLAVTPPLQARPDIAASGDVSLAVWRESGIGAALVDANGGITPLGKLTEAYTATDPHVASNGDGWMVVWVTSPTLYGMRIARDGTRVDAEPFVIAQITFVASNGVAWDGERYVAVYVLSIPSRVGSTSTVMAARIDANNGIEQVMLSPGGAQYFDPVITTGGNGVLVAWWDRTPTPGVAGVLLSRGGTMTPLAFPDHDVAIGGPAVAWNGSTFVVAALYTNDVQWFRVSPTGVVTPTAGTAAVPVKAPGSRSVDLAAIGERFLLLAHGHAAVLDPRGFTAEPPVAVVPNVPARTDGRWVIYTVQTDAARPELTRVFVRQIGVAANPRRRRAV